MPESWGSFLRRFQLDSLTVDAGFLEIKVNFNEADRKAAWEIYVELATRTATQPLPDGHGDEAAALESLAQLFSVTRQILRAQGPGCQNVAQLAVLVLNGFIRPVTAKWHPIKLKEQLRAKANRAAFRRELRTLQGQLVSYTRAIGHLAGVEHQLVA